MEEKPALVQRKLSRKNSKNTSGKSLWHRKSTKKSTEPASTATATLAANNFPSLDSTLSLPVTMDSSDDNDGTRSSHENHLSSLLSRSIIPDPLGELPVWFKKESEMAAANISSFRIKYPLHNPNGPRWYKNHHLLPATHLNSPPSFFSTSFPPMAASIQERSEDSTRLPAPSRTPSSTPLPTPSSSQVRILDPNPKPRSRKTSQDNVDLMDISDPWGTHWHHQSPYDAGSSISPVSVDSPEGPPRTRSRLSSMNTGPTRRKTVTPSPLSQSTSALHLQSPEPTHVTRKLSKRRKLGGLFGSHDKGASEDPEADSLDNSSSGVPKRSSTVPNGGLHLLGGSRRHSILSPMAIPVNGSTAALSGHSSSKNDRRQSVLGRLVRKFSILKRSTQDAGGIISERAEDNEHSVGVTLSAVDEQPLRRSFISQRQSSPEKPVMEKRPSDPSKRIPPPRLDLEPETQAEGGRGPSMQFQRETSDHRSSISCDVPFSPLGKLTIANPDAPSSGGTTPVRIDLVLPPEVPSEPPPEPKPQVRDAQTAQYPHPAHAQNVSQRSYTSAPLTAAPMPSLSGRSSPVKGLLSPISVAAPTFSFPDIPQFLAGSHTPTPSALTPFSPPPSSALRLSTSAPTQNFLPAPSLGDLPSRSSLLQAPLSVPVLPIANDSPLSEASVLANPPTPYSTGESDHNLPVLERVSTNQTTQKAPSRDASPTKQVDAEVRLTKSNSGTSRKTETYKLVRNPSDKVSSASEAFNAEGEQWLVINSADVPRRRRTREKAEKSDRVEQPSSRTSRERERERERPRPKELGRDRERERERESRRRRQERAAQEVADNQRRAASHARVNTPPADKRNSGSLSGRPSRARSLDTSQRPTLLQPLIFTLQDDPPPLGKDDRTRDSIHQGHSKPTRPGPSPIVAVARVERYPSTSARPTSELTSAADINALKAREAWEMDRLWKGRSMYQGQPEINVIVSPSSTKESRLANGEPARDVMSMHSIAHGSSHTSYVVQPLQAHPIPASVFYANMPSAPPPIIYAASPHGQPHSSRDYATYRSLPNSFTFPSKDGLADSPSRQNPLPAPPRESSYQPAHLPVLTDRSGGSASEYWTKYTNMPSHS
ncbi:hypothetical protein PAXRUDRAFT_8128 [Paxillus rubicundulus Ve08.2h10]|uniref:Uncharacterized protein n=1 Tax=Paxillus rubicundulus Ve08.2h10 TaxID=930991 RepID=A0A0D0E6G0_9AGAM|nr:hypothetical protein PAXRUDRAFT_8128 [Paxillus rubicundulus Ve08.2h10]